MDVETYENTVNHEANDMDQDIVSLMEASEFLQRYQNETRQISRSSPP